jgi:hypothetical protein
MATEERALRQTPSKNSEQSKVVGTAAGKRSKAPHTGSRTQQKAARAGAVKG